MIDFDVEKSSYTGVVIKVVGIGGAGCNTVTSLFKSGCNGIDCILANTDAQALEAAEVTHKVQIGVKTTKGLGAGANPELGQRSAEEDLDKVLEMIGDANIVFLTGGMGGGTASGALPVIARAVKERGILVIALVTKPFGFEGKRRARVAQEAIAKLHDAVDTLIVIPNQKLIEIVDNKVSMIDAFAMINSVLSQSVRGISDIITKPGHINVDFADVRIIMKDMGLAVLGTGRAQGPERALEAAMEAISSPLLENMSIDGARGVLLNITGGRSLALHEISAAASLIYERADENANIIIGSVIDETMDADVSVTIIATGFDHRQTMSVAQAKEPVRHVQDDTMKMPHRMPYAQTHVAQSSKESHVVVQPAARVDNALVGASSATQDTFNRDVLEIQVAPAQYADVQDIEKTDMQHADAEHTGIKATGPVYQDHNAVEIAFRKDDDLSDTVVAKGGKKQAKEESIADLAVGDMQLIENDFDTPSYLRKAARDKLSEGQ